MKEAYESTSTWLKDNHEALTGEIEKLDNDLNKQYMVMCKNYLKFLEGTEVDGEVTKQEKFRSEVSPELARLKAGLFSKTPAKVASQAAPTGAVQQRQDAQQQEV